jgi:hypothetical protein
MFAQDHIKRTIFNLSLKCPSLCHTSPDKCFHAFAYGSALLLLNYSKAPTGDFHSKNHNAVALYD